MIVIYGQIEILQICLRGIFVRIFVNLFIAAKDYGKCQHHMFD